MVAKYLYIAFFCAFIFANKSNAQDTSILQNLSGIGLQINSVGGLGLENGNGMEYPIGSGKYPLRRLNFWITAINKNGDTVAVASDAFSKETNWTEGPFGTNIPSHLSRKKWMPFYVVSKQETDKHQMSWMNGAYSAPIGISKWPSALNHKGFPIVCAPFLDFNEDGFYKPLDGDYPYLSGNKNVFVMGSDSANLSSLKTHQTGLDMSVLWYEPLKADSIPNTNYFRLTICNRKNDTFTNLKLSVLADFKIGNTIDDQLATHVGYNSIFAYNQPGGDAIYGATWPAVAVGWLSGKASASIYMFPDNSAVQGKPTNEVQFYNYANGLWRSGKNLGSTGSGLDASTSSKFIYSGTTDSSIGKNRNWTNKDGNAGRQTALISSAAYTFNGVGCKVMDGYVSVIPNAPDSGAMEHRFKSIFSHYNKQDYTLAIPKNKFLKSIDFYPNPVISGSVLNIKNSAIQNIKIYNFTGILVYETRTPENSILIKLTEGNYLIKINDNPMQILQVTE